jgi:ligand-binding SRPBCC domain-containing protein
MEKNEQTPSDLLNWRKVSAFLSGNEQSVRRKRVYEKHTPPVSELIKIIADWMTKNKPGN